MSRGIANRTGGPCTSWRRPWTWIAVPSRGACESLENKALPHLIHRGSIYDMHMTWNRNTDRVRKVPLNIDPKKVDWKAFLGSAPAQDFDEYRFRNWRWFWDFGGGILTDLMVHWIDVNTRSKSA